MMGGTIEMSLDVALITMHKTGKSMFFQLKETALGRLATIPTGIKLRQEILGK